MSAGLPAPRQILSSLVTSVCQSPPQSSSPFPANPSLKASIPPSRREFLLTLHVLFPTLLLPALDLLDRGLITQFSLITNPKEKDDGRSREDQVYIVKSLASTLKREQRRGTTKQSSEGKYIVRLTAWNCTCASFALEAYGTVRQASGSEGMQEGSLFGGLGLDETDIPCCKHVLACLLAKHWDTVLGGRIGMECVTKEELAGIIADG